VNNVANQLILSACIVELDALRYTPAGLPALNMKLEHESDIQEAGQSRQVKAALKAVAFGAIAERLLKQAVGSAWKFNGFLATPRNSKQLVFHIQEFQQINEFVQI
jgi:primosomal replication protein N